MQTPPARIVPTGRSATISHGARSFSLAVVKAMACGLPVVATDCSSILELVIDGKSGFLCPIGDEM